MTPLLALTLPLLLAVLYRLLVTGPEPDGLPNWISVNRMEMDAAAARGKR